jgi:dihydroceramidase
MAAAPAQQALAPFWGHPDSNIDWCEHNYEVTPYVAEFWNAVSSVPILLLGVYGFAMQPIHLGDRRFRFIFTLLGYGARASTHAPFIDAPT